MHATTEKPHVVAAAHHRDAVTQALYCMLITVDKSQKQKQSYITADSSEGKPHIGAAAGCAAALAAWPEWPLELSELQSQQLPAPLLAPAQPVNTAQLLFHQFSQTSDNKHTSSC